MIRAWEYLSMLLYAMCKGNLVSFPHQVASVKLVDLHLNLL